MVIREAAVRLAEQRHHLAAQRLQRRHCQIAGNPVARVHDDLEGSGKLDLPHHRLDIFCDQIDALDRTIALAENALEHASTQSQQLVTVQYPVTNDDLEPVVIRRVVTAGNHDTGLHRLSVHREIQQRGRRLPDIEHVATTGVESTHQRLGQLRTGRPRVARHGNPMPPLLLHQRRHRLTEQLGERACQRLANHTAHVVGAKKRVRNIDLGCLARARRQQFRRVAVEFLDLHSLCP